ncbi:hypothetical protein Tco_1387322 [Tanacetum coccineum]
MKNNGKSIKSTTKTDRKSSTGMNGSPKKGGHGGKFTWSGDSKTELAHSVDVYHVDDHDDVIDNKSTMTSSIQYRVLVDDDDEDDVIDSKSVDV